jgi:tRNA A64-2'-O-ribosylphosphate transferase
VGHGKPSICKRCSCFFLLTISQGLTPEIFWAHRERLLTTDRKALPDLISSLVFSVPSQPAHIHWISLPSPIVKVDGRLLLTSIPDLPQPLPAHLPVTEHEGDPIAYVIIESSADPLHLFDSASLSSNVLHIHSPGGKKGQLVSRILPQSITFIQSKLFVDDRIRVCIACDDGRDLSVGIALAALTLFYNDRGQLSAESEAITCKYLPFGYLSSLTQLQQ